MTQIDWDVIKHNLITELTKLKGKYPHLNKNTRKEIAEEIVNEFSTGKLDYRPVFLEKYLKTLEEQKEISPKRQEANLQLSIDCYRVAKGVIEEILGTATKGEVIEEEEIRQKAIEFKEKYSGIIGRISLSVKTPSTPSGFSFWLKDDRGIHVEPGTIITVEEEQRKNGDEIQEERIIGIVEDLKAMSDVPTCINEFYSTGYGNPEEELAIERPVIREATARVIKRSDGRVEPVTRKWPIYFASREDIIDAYAGEIDKRDRMLLGFTYDEKKKPVPIFGDFNYMFGYKSAHINIAGSSGLAAKTSYALFLIASTLAYAQKAEKKDIGIIAFNVKERDLLRITKFRGKFGELEGVISKLEKDDNYTFRKSAELWREAKNNGVDPFDVFSDATADFYEPDTNYKFGFKDIVELGAGTDSVFRMMFDAEDVNDVFLSLLSGIIEEFGNKSFGEIKSRLGQKKRSEKVNVGDVPTSGLTIDKFLRRLEVAGNQLHKIIEMDLPSTGVNKRIPVQKMKSGEVKIINIEPLPDRGKRIVFMSVLKTVNRILEAKREGKESINIYGDDINLQSYPDRIAIFIDELNKFAPKGKQYSSIKYPIIDIAARGRSIGLSLIGAEQMASQIDEEILANCSTFAIGRAHPVEIRDKSYDWLRGDLKQRANIMRPGEIIGMHAIHSAPILMHFPIPLHDPYLLGDE